MVNGWTGWDRCQRLHFICYHLFHVNHCCQRLYFALYQRLEFNQNRMGGSIILAFTFGLVLVIVIVLLLTLILVLALVLALVLVCVLGRAFICLLLEHRQHTRPQSLLLVTRLTHSNLTRGSWELTRGRGESTGRRGHLTGDLD